jgi:hypothetical protein
MVTSRKRMQAHFLKNKDVIVPNVQNAASVANALIAHLPEGVNVWLLVLKE